MSGARYITDLDLIASDLARVTAMFTVLDQAASVEGVHEVTIRFTGEGGDQIVVGYGESAEPAIVSILAARSER